MESFIKWGNEKRQLDEVLGLAAVAAGAIGGVGTYLWQNGKKRRDKRSDFWVYKKDAPEAERQKTFAGDLIVRMVRTGELKMTDLIAPPGSQNWETIKDAKKLLPFDQITKGKARDDTVWWAWLNGERVKYNSSKEFAQAIAKREVEADTKVFRNGYDDWMPYKSKDVQDDMHRYVDAEPPTLGNQKFIGAKTLYLMRGKEQPPIKFEDLGGKVKMGVINDDSYVWVQGYKRDWVRFKEIKHMVPSIGQAVKTNPRGMFGKLGQFAKNAKTKSINPWSNDHKDQYIRDADTKDRTPAPSPAL